jgi:opacity protein-like surface antigen
MKRIAKSLVVVGAMLAAGSAAADMMDDVRPYIGLDYYQAWMKGAKGTTSRGTRFDFTKDAPKSYPGATFYVGAKFTDCFGLELGADWSARKKKTTLDAGDTVKTEVKRNGFHGDIVGFFPLNDCVDILGFVGLGWVKPKTTITTSAVGFATVTETLKNKGKTVARLGLGASYMVTEMVGLRAKIGWENTRRLKLQDTVPPIDTFKAFKDTVSLSLGAFVRW